MNYVFGKEVTIFGDSITKGMYFDGLKPQKIQNSFVEILQKEGNLSITNNSVFGQTLKRVYEKGIIQTYALQNDVDNRVCVIALGGNDSDYNWLEVQNGSAITYAPKTSLEEFSFMLENLVEILKEKNIIPILCSLCPVDSNRYFDNVLAKKFDGTKILEFLHGDKQNIYRYQELYNNEIIKLAMKTNTIFFDYRKEFLKRADYTQLMCLDGIHPNEQGHKLIAEFAQKFMEEKQSSALFSIFAHNNIKIQQNTQKNG